MKKQFLCVFLLVFCFSAPMLSQIKTVKVVGGTVEGIINNGIASFKGIPFAAPPVGDLRWKAPQPVIPWEGVKRVDAFGATPMQDKKMSRMLAQNPIMSEDCLYLNVWSGAKDVNEKLPVMVWIYGGGFAAGSTSTPIYDGTSFAKNGVVFVSIAYRVGAMGFLAHPDLSKESGKGSGCFGIQDQVAALKWVKENIAKFGGNPENVTIFGQSAGSFSCSILSAVPDAKGLFHRIIAQSGAYMEPLRYGNEAGQHSVSLKLAEETGREFLSKLGADNIDAARALSAEDIQNSIPSLPVFKFWPVADGITIPGDLYEQYLAGKFNDVPVIIGTNSDEGGSFVPFAQALKPDGFEKMIRDGYGPVADGILKVYPHTTDLETFKSEKDIWRETLFAWPAWAWANLHTKKSKSKTYVYYFDVHNDKSKDGAIHSAEICYVLGFPYGINGGKPSPNDKYVMNLMNSYWINFAKNGDPNGPGLPVWSTYDQKRRKTMIFDDSTSVRPLPNVDKYKAFDVYYSWRRQQNREIKL